MANPTDNLSMQRIHSDVILYICQYLDAHTLLLLAGTCHRFYQLLVKRPEYWRQRYLHSFYLLDWRERDWLAWFNRQMHPTAITSTENDQASLAFGVSTSSMTGALAALSSTPPILPNANETQDGYVPIQPVQSTRDHVCERATTVDDNGSDRDSTLEHTPKSPTYPLAAMFNEKDISTLTDYYCRSLTDCADYLDSLGHEWSNINWFLAYFRRLQTTHRLLYSQKWHARSCHLPLTSPTDRLSIAGINAWGTLLRETDGTRMWAICHDTFDHVTGQYSRSLQWKELRVPDSIGRLTVLDYCEITNSYVIMWGRVAMPTGVPICDADAEEDDVDERGVILLWPNIDQGNVSTVYMQSLEEVEQDCSLPQSQGMYDDWLLTQQPMPASEASADTSVELLQYRVYDMVRQRWLLGPFGDKARSHAHIQAVTKDRIEVAVCTLRDDVPEKELKILQEAHPISVTTASVVSASTNDYTDSENDGGLDLTLPPLLVDWSIYTAHSSGHTDMQSTRTGSVLLPRWPNPKMDAQEYGPSLALLTIYDPDDSNVNSGGPTPHALLVMLHIGEPHDTPRFARQRYSSSAHRDTSYCVERSGLAKPLWIRPVGTKIIAPLCSEDLVLVQKYRIFDVLDARNGDLVRRIHCAAYNLFYPVIGSVCALLGMHQGIGYLLDMSTGASYTPVEQMLTAEQSAGAIATAAAASTDLQSGEPADWDSQDSTQSQPADAANTADDADTEERDEREDSCYRLSCANISVIDKRGGRYRLYMLPFMQ